MHTLKLAHALKIALEFACVTTIYRYIPYTITACNMFLRCVENTISKAQLN